MRANDSMMVVMTLTSLMWMIFMTFAHDGTKICSHDLCLNGAANDIEEDILNVNTELE